ncbi:hypothetical protein Cni_G02780 [Canna indica]|uniref:Uncharacterized protein n=1 Tax=Canna indica TaxID=4628 RepID=A0AAQ3JRF4_9LILI|nr:hypothetical protein Cni_G02780 [Canna indica]
MTRLMRAYIKHLSAISFSINLSRRAREADRSTMTLSLLRDSNTRANEFILIRTYSFARLSRYLHKLILFLYRLSAFHFSAFSAQLCYFVSLSLLGSLLMTLLKPSSPSFSPRYVDMLFMSTSALTVAGLATVIMEDLSSPQIVVLMLLMFLGGDVFVTLLGLLFQRTKQQQKTAANADGRVESSEVELESIDADLIESSVIDIPAATDGKDSIYNCARYLGYVVVSYVAIFHLASSARSILEKKGINVFLFSISTTISSFANAGIIATNENMAIFNRNPVILLLMIAQVLAGNTLFPLLLRPVIWALRKITRKEEFEQMLESKKAGSLSPLLAGR